MTIEIVDANLTYHGEGWALAMSKECAAAERTIHISALSMTPPTEHKTGHWQELWQAWCAAAKRGVNVHIWLPSPSEIYPATKGNIGAGRAIIEAGMHPHFVQGSRLLHAKTAIIDARTIWIGSGNFTAAAAHFNHEAYLRADCKKIAKQLIERWESIA